MTDYTPKNNPSSYRLPLRLLLYYVRPCIRIRPPVTTWACVNSETGGRQHDSPPIPVPLVGVEVITSSEFSLPQRSEGKATTAASPPARTLLHARPPEGLSGVLRPVPAPLHI